MRTSVEASLVDAGFKPGDRISVNRAKLIGVFGVAALVAAVASQVPSLSVENVVPFELFFLIVLGMVSGVVYWHATRPEIVFEKEGLRVAGHAYPWNTVQSVEMGSWEIVVLTNRPHEGPKRFVAVRASPSRAA